MKYLDEFRDPALAERLVREIRRAATRRWTIMEVCGGQTHSLLRHGIEEELQDVVELIHGPGCPVCVTPREAIDLACRLALDSRVILTSFGDMLRVPGSRCSLQATEAVGGNVQPVYSPADAVALARRNPERDIVFFAVGFETTAPATALAVLHASQFGLRNFSLLVAHVRVQPAMEALANDSDCRVEGFLAAGHVCTVAGYESYKPFVARHGIDAPVGEPRRHQGDGQPAPAADQHAGGELDHQGPPVLPGAEPHATHERVPEEAVPATGVEVDSHAAEDEEPGRDAERLHEPERPGHGEEGRAVGDLGGVAPFAEARARCHQLVEGHLAVA